MHGQSGKNFQHQRRAAEIGPAPGVLPGGRGAPMAISRACEFFSVLRLWYRKGPMSAIGAKRTGSTLDVAATNLDRLAEFCGGHWQDFAKSNGLILT